MFASTTEHTVHYRIRPARDAGAFRLTVWEVTPAPAPSAQPYLYTLNYVLRTLEEAQQVLRNHLFVNGVASATTLELPNRGSVHVLPFETWSDFAVRVEPHEAHVDRTQQKAS